ncbi:hypothetical protein B4102_0537 [Heyndrickxia sporothermodurans]|uniref:Uncharacterized protein n=1 Tax=Heyndrickxia sporothermodurans TaxID=46224 RepID=A0A150L6F4_9BACI|nr:hypothetical protein B4102_0537 [Heyndrickxia sporothermodurans]
MFSLFAHIPPLFLLLFSFKGFNEEVEKEKRRERIPSFTVY